MPFEAPKGGGGLEGLELLFKLQALKQAQLDRQEDQRRDMLRTALSVVGAGGDPSSLLGGLDQGTAAALMSARDAQMRAQEQDAFAQLTQPQVAGAYGAALAPVADTAGNITPPSNEERLRALDAYTARARAMGVPEQMIPTVVQQAEVYAQGAARSQQEQVSTERRASAERRASQDRAAGIAAAADARQEAYVRGREERQAARELEKEKRMREDAAVENYSDQIAASSMGLLDPRANTELSRQIASSFGGQAPELMTRIGDRARAKVAGFKTEIELKESAKTADVQAIADAWNVPRSSARAILGGAAIIDPVMDEPGPSAVIPVSQGGAQKMLENRQALADMIGIVGDLEGTFDRARRANAGGPLIGEEGPQAFLRAIGAQQPEAAEFDTKRKFATRKAIEAFKDPRPSDFDIRFYLSMFPSLSELYSGSAEGRFKALEDMLRMQALSPYNRDIQSQIRARRDDFTPADRRVQRAMERYANAGPDDTDAAAAFDTELSAWKRTRGNRFQLPNSGNASDSPGVDAAREYMSRNGFGGP
jgi:hypothetical protein